MNKKQWRRYNSEQGESWQVFIDENEQGIEHTVSSKGHSAVMRKIIDPIDFVIVSAIPCVNQDEFNKTLYDKNLFQLKLELMNGDDWFAFSGQKFKKDEIVKLISLFVGLDKNQAERVWKGKKLGNFNTYKNEVSF
ncbi:hypothetical protein [Tenacibaculum maritimum]|uniref:Uncharacterized protein n=1 Tax=Tenacibaculum maritimum NCIMB 2154 TaxID=1349785 RepID=A0A2H1ED03_9FLAO|nr:hypothetical protein [Tenacibaculum maritimum]SFZ84425.1 conserved protein of unknown function [Tenacibaculum maritimum NCIMB 2154]